jgi:hypothetical protein
VKVRGTTQKRRPEAGIALLISIFVLLLISVVAIALIVSSGTESALAGNYRSATGVYYAALAGLEEARGRLLPKNSSAFTITAPTLLPPPGTPLAVGQPFYIINPVGGETVAPWDPSNAYADNQFNPEFATSGYTLPNPSPNTSSLSTVAGIQGPTFKWVRINAVSEKSLGFDVDNDGSLDPSSPVYYDGRLSKLTMSTTNTRQVFEITSLAVLPNGSQNSSQKLLQYLAALVPVNFPDFPTSQLSFPAALTIAGGTANGVAFSPPTSNGSYWVSGVDLTSVPFCTAGPPVDAIGVFDNGDVAYVTSGGNGGVGIPGPMQNSYDGKPNPPNPRPDVVNVIANGSFPASLQTPSKLNSLAQSIIFNADAIAPPAGGNATGADLTPLLVSVANPAGMSPTNPLTVVVNGDLDLTGWHQTGYGLLLVTGNLNYDPDASWQGMVLVIGKGTVTGSRSGSGEFDGAFFVAKTRDSAGVMLPDPDLGTASVIFSSGMGGVGMRYSSCWVQKAQPTSSLKILSFHEIAQ